MRKQFVFRFTGMLLCLLAVTATFAQHHSSHRSTHTSHSAASKQTGNSGFKSQFQHETIKEIRFVTFLEDTYPRVAPKNNAKVANNIDYCYDNQVHWEMFQEGKTYASVNDDFIDLGNGWYKLHLYTCGTTFCEFDGESCYIPKKSVSIKKYKVTVVPKQDFANKKIVFKNNAGACIEYAKLHLNDQQCFIKGSEWEMSDGDFYDNWDQAERDALKEYKNILENDISTKYYYSDYRTIEDSRGYFNSQDSDDNGQIITLLNDCVLFRCDKDGIDSNGNIHEDVNLEYICISAGVPPSYSYYIPELNAVFDGQKMNFGEDAIFYASNVSHKSVKDGFASQYGENITEMRFVTFKEDTYGRVSPSFSAKVKNLTCPQTGDDHWKFLKGKTYASVNDAFVDLGNGWYKVCLKMGPTSYEPEICYIPKKSVTIKKYKVIAAPKDEFVQNKTVFKNKYGLCLEFAKINLNGHSCKIDESNDYFTNGDLYELKRMLETEISYKEYFEDYRLIRDSYYDFDAEKERELQYEISVTLKEPCTSFFCMKSDIDSDGRMQKDVTFVGTCAAAGVSPTYSYYIPELNAVFDGQEMFFGDNDIYYSHKENIESKNLKEAHNTPATYSEIPSNQANQGTVERIKIKQ